MAECFKSFVMIIILDLIHFMKIDVGNVQKTESDDPRVHFYVQHINQSAKMTLNKIRQRMTQLSSASSRSVSMNVENLILHSNMSQEQSRNEILFCVSGIVFYCYKLSLSWERLMR